ncbi:hypothetical protein [Streptomyces sp. WAC 06783]|uniref:hypothetical protein n=1 Tax=Streptomyces sp. WAC 06783 TaxID=2203211 RepID=UPI00163D0564|nr:hypothetical protein [Streptomyces sp. WAC 06783]
MQDPPVTGAWWPLPRRERTLPGAERRLSHRQPARQQPARRRLSRTELSHTELSHTEPSRTQRPRTHSHPQRRPPHRPVPRPPVPGHPAAAPGDRAAHTPAPGPAARIGRALLGQWHRVAGPTWAALCRRRLAAVPLTTASVLLVITCHALALTDTGSRLVWALGGVRADVPLWLVPLRLPLSLFAPAPGLPWWGALAQVIVIFGVAECVLGTVRTATVSLVVTAAATLFARFVLTLGPGHPLAVPASEAVLADTGPSAAVVGLLICVGWACRAPLLIYGTALTFSLECVLTSTLSSRAHLGGIVAALLCAAVTCRTPVRAASAPSAAAPSSAATPSGRDA